MLFAIGGCGGTEDKILAAFFLSVAITILGDDASALNFAPGIFGANMVQGPAGAINESGFFDATLVGLELTKSLFFTGRCLFAVAIKFKATVVFSGILALRNEGAESFFFAVSGSLTIVMVSNFAPGPGLGTWSALPVEFAHGSVCAVLLGVDTFLSFVIRYA